MLQQAEFLGFGDDADGVADIELFKEPHPVPANGLIGKAEPVGNFLAGESFCKQWQDFGLSVGEFMDCLGPLLSAAAIIPSVFSSDGIVARTSPITSSAPSFCLRRRTARKRTRTKPSSRRMMRMPPATIQVSSLRWTS